MKYEVRNNNGDYEVLETPSGHVIRNNLNYDIAKKEARRFNLGAGFDGYTPDFFMNTIKIRNQNYVD